MLESEISSLPHSLNKSLLGVTPKSNGYLDSSAQKRKKTGVFSLISPVPSTKIRDAWKAVKWPEKRLSMWPLKGEPKGRAKNRTEAVQYEEYFSLGEDNPKKICCPLKGPVKGINIALLSDWVRQFIYLLLSSQQCSERRYYLHIFPRWGTGFKMIWWN